MDWVKGLALEVRPLPTIAAVTAGITGLAMGGDLEAALPYGALIAVVLFLSHLKDSWVDYYLRGEDRRWPYGPFPATGALMSERSMFAAMGVAGVAFGGLLVWLQGAPWTFYLLAAVGAGLALSYAPVLDRSPMGSALSYPVGVGMAVVAGGYLAAGGLVQGTLFYAVPLVVALAGAKVVEDRIDAEHDAALGKRTVPVVLGSRRARRLGYAAVAVGLAGLVPIGAPVAVAVVAASGVWLAAARVGGEMEVYPLVAGIFLVMVAVLVHSLV